MFKHLPKTSRESSCKPSKPLQAFQSVKRRQGSGRLTSRNAESRGMATSSHDKCWPKDVGDAFGKPSKAKKIPWSKNIFILPKSCQLQWSFHEHPGLLWVSPLVTCRSTHTLIHLIVGLLIPYCDHSLKEGIYLLNKSNLST